MHRKEMVHVSNNKVERRLVGVIENRFCKDNSLHLMTHLCLPRDKAFRCTPVMNAV